MFKRNDNNNGPTTGASDAAETEDRQQPPQLPDWRVFRVRRFKANPTDDEVVAANGTSPLEEVTVSAMLVQVTDAGGLIFSVWRVDPVLGPTTGAVRGFATYYDFEEVPQPPPSQILH